MFRRLTEEPVDTPTRKQVRAARMKNLKAVHCLEAREASLKLKPPRIAWVYLLLVPGRKSTHVVRFSVFPESFLFDEPGSELKPLAGFQEGIQVWNEGDRMPQVKTKG